MKPPDPTKKASTHIVCPPHASAYLAAELEALGYEPQETYAAGVDIGATLIECMDLCLRLHTAQHVQWTLARFRCPSPKALYTQLSAYPWESLVPADGHLTVRAVVDNPKIDNTVYARQVVKDAVVDRLVEKVGTRPTSGPDPSGVVLALHWVGDRATIRLNANGSTLSDRGYRRIGGSAPMRESLAASVLMAAGYDGTTPLINPMCGSGTLAIEAALMAAGRAPGVLRPSCSAVRTTLGLDDAWQEARRRARAQRAPHEPPPIIAADHDPAAVDLARSNAQTAGVEHLIHFEVCDVADTPIPDVHPDATDARTGHIVLNPPYGERLGDIDELGETYAAIGDYLKRAGGGWTGHVFTGSRELAKRVGLRAARRTPFMNGSIECRLLSFPLYAGSRSTPDEGTERD